MKKFTKISLIIAAVLVGMGSLLCGISSVMGAGYGTIYQMARDGELNYGILHIDGDGVYFGNDGMTLDVDDDEVHIGSDILSIDVNDDEVHIGSDILSIDVDENGNVAGEIGTSGVPGTDSNDSTFYVAEGETDSTDGTSYVYDIAGISDLDIDINAASIFFVTGERSDAIVVTLEDCKEKYYEGKINGDKLKIAYDVEMEHDIFINDMDMKITIAIPAGMSFDEIDMDMGATNAEFELTDVSCNTLNMDMGAGNVIADAFHVNELLKVTVGAGNVEIYGGSYKNIKIDCGLGNFSMQGKLVGDIDADCGMGSMELQLKGDADAYNYKLSCGMGDLNVNGTSYSSIAGDHRVTNAGAVGTIDLDCGMGSIELDIEE